MGMLKFIKASFYLPWMCIGDFDEVLLQSEHEGVLEHSRSQIAGFQEMVDVCGGGTGVRRSQVDL